MLANNFTNANKRMKTITMSIGARIIKLIISSKKSTSTGKKQQMKYNSDILLTIE